MTESSKSALVVDDSPTMRLAVVNALEHAGFEVTQAKSGLDALKVLAQDRPFNVIITDVNMPDITGLELVRRVRDNPRRKHTPLIIISTDGRDKDIERGMKLGANHYLKKPFEPDVLIAAVKHHVEMAAEASKKAAAGESS